MHGLLSVGRAYPRSRGGTGTLDFTINTDTGLSPLARGNHRGLQRVRDRRGPIPARAGEPPAVDVRRYPLRAYPRSRGGTFQARARLTKAWGLSPLARGN